MNNTNKDLTEKIINLEKGALDKWFKGDTSGYLNIWSQEDFSYFDGAVTKRIDSYADIKTFVLANVEGKLFADQYNFENPRVQLGEDMAVLTYQLYAKTSLIDMQYQLHRGLSKTSYWMESHSLHMVIYSAHGYELWRN